MWVFGNLILSRTGTFKCLATYFKVQFLCNKGQKISKTLFLAFPTLYYPINYFTCQGILGCASPIGRRSLAILHQKFMLLFVLPSLTVPWSAACPLANIVLTNMPICPLGESRPPTTENPSPFFPGPFSNVTVINWVCCCKLLSELLRRFVPSHDPPSDM